MFFVCFISWTHIYETINDYDVICKYHFYLIDGVKVLIYNSKCYDVILYHLTMVHFFTWNVCDQKIGCHIPSLLIQDWPQICILCISVYWWYPTYAWQIGPFWQDTLVLWNDSGNCHISLEVQRPTGIVNMTAEFVLTSFYVIYGMKCAKYDICSERTGYKYI